MKSYKIVGVANVTSVMTSVVPVLLGKPMRRTDRMLGGRTCLVWKRGSIEVVIVPPKTNGSEAHGWIDIFDRNVFADRFATEVAAARAMERQLVRIKASFA